MWIDVLTRGTGFRNKGGRDETVSFRARCLVCIRQRHHLGSLDLRRAVARPLARSSQDYEHTRLRLVGRIRLS